MSRSRNRTLENRIYVTSWFLIIIAYLLDVVRVRHTAGVALLDTGVFSRMALGLLPFIVLFGIHNWIIIPRLLFRNRYLGYLAATMLTLASVWGCQAITFLYLFSVGHHLHHAPGPPPIVPLPMLLDLVYDLLIVGVNLAVALIFQRLDDRLERERIHKTHAENQLAYLKAQINPHFYLNMLNNIHGMIELNAEKAQEMVIDMSNLMRYTLYDSANERIALSAEVNFLNNYLRLMRQRYPANRVEITARFPDSIQSAGVMIPPLLFLVFLENSFKHGISYREKSFVNVAIAVTGGEVVFTCSNSCHPSPHVEASGIGLKNVRERLRLIFGNHYRYEVAETPESYSVTLALPIHESTPHSDN